MADNPHFNRISTAFQKAVNHIHRNKGYKPEMLADGPVRELITATCDTLTEPLHNIGLRQEVPPELTAAIDENTFYFSGFKTHHELVEASRLLKGDDGNFKPFEQFRRDVEAIDSTYNRNYLQAEYNFAAAASQMAVKWKEWEQDGDDYDLQYRTAGDDRVREEHAALDGITLPPSDPFWNSYLPPNGWNCRCTTVQVRKGKYPQSDPEEAAARGAACTARPKQQIFRFNPGKQQKIFPPKHPYLPKYPDCANCDYQKLAWQANRTYCRICSMIKKCYQKEESENATNLKRFTPEEKHKIYSKPISEQFEDIYTSKNHIVKRHVLRDENGMDYNRVLTAAKLYSKSSDVELLPEIHKSEIKIRERIGLVGNANPDLHISGHQFVDVKSPFSYKNIISNAIDASRQQAIACLTDDHTIIRESNLEQLSKRILNNEKYTKDEVHWVVNGNLYKYNSLGLIQD